MQPECHPLWYRRTPPDTNNVFEGVGRTGIVLADGEASTSGVNSDPQESSNIELGAKWDFFNSGFTLSSAIFHTENENVIYTDPLTGLATDSGSQKVDGITFGAGLRYQGSTYNGTANTVEIPSYAVVHSLVQFDVNPNLNLRLNVYNLLDREYVATSGGGDGGGGGSATTGGHVGYGAPISFAFSTNFTF